MLRRESTALLADIEAAQKPRPDAAVGLLKQWNAYNSQEGRAYALTVFKGLRELGSKAVAEEVMDLGLHTVNSD